MQPNGPATPPPPQPGQHPYSFEDEYDAVHLADLWEVVRRRMGVVFAVLGVTLAASAWMVLRQPDLYSSRLSLQVNDPSERGRSLNVVRNLSFGDFQNDRVLSEIQVLLSSSTAERVVEKLGLQLVPGDPELLRSDLFRDASVAAGHPPAVYHLEYSDDGRRARLLDEYGRDLASGPVGEPLAAGRVTLTPLPPPAAAQSYALYLYAAEEMAAEVMGGLAANPREETDFMDVTFTGRDPVTVPRVLTAAAEALRERGVEKMKTQASVSVDFLESQLDSAYQDFNRAMSDVQAFKESRAFTNLSSEEQKVFEDIESDQREAEELHLELASYSTLIQQLERGGVARRDLESLAALESLLSNPSIRHYISQYLDLRDERQEMVSGAAALSPSHPDVKGIDSRLVQIEENLLAGLRSQLDQVRQRQERLLNQVSQGRAELSRLPGMEKQLDNLQTEADVLRDSYNYLLAELTRAELAEAVVTPYVDVIDTASRARPVSGRGSLKVLLGGLLGLMLGVGLALFLDYIDRSLRSTREVETYLGLGTVGLIPRLSSRRVFPLLPYSISSNGTPAGGNGSTGASRTLQPLVADAHSPGVEAYRSLQLNLRFARSSDNPVRAITISSAGPTEGKSTTAINLATVLAQEGNRTLLMDGDLRRPTLHKAFGQLRNPGLSNLLIGETPLEGVIRERVLPNLDVITAGPLPPNSAELLGSDVLKGVFERLRGEYDWVIVDSPPILAASDAALLGRQTDGVVFVVRAGDTDRGAAAHAIERLQKLDTRVVGAVLNEVDRTSSPEANYTRYYYRYAPTDGEEGDDSGRSLRSQLSKMRFW